MSGDHTLFTTAEGIERLWELSAPLLEAAAGSPRTRRVVGPERHPPAVAPHTWRLPFERAWRENR